MKMKTMLATLLVLISLSAFAGGTNLFNKNEFGINLGSAYVDSATIDNSKWGATLGVSAFPFQKYLGVEAETTLSDGVTPAFNNVSGYGILRLPIDKWHVAPYAIGGYKWTAITVTGNNYAWSAGAGLEARLNSKWGVYGDYQRVFGDLKDANQVRVGLHLVF